MFQEARLECAWNSVLVSTDYWTLHTATSNHHHYTRTKPDVRPKTFNLAQFGWKYYLDEEKERPNAENFKFARINANNNNNNNNNVYWLQVGRHPVAVVI